MAGQETVPGRVGEQQVARKRFRFSVFPELGMMHLGLLYFHVFGFQISDVTSISRTIAANITSISRTIAANITCIPRTIASVDGR